MIEGFAEITRGVIASEGFEQFNPTLIVPARRILRALDGIPEGVDVEQAAMKWAEGAVESGDEYVLAYKLNARQFRIVHCNAGTRTHADFDAQP